MECLKKLRNKEQGPKLLPFPAHSQRLGQQCIIDEHLGKIDLPKASSSSGRWRLQRPAVWLDRSIIVTTNAMPAQGALPPKLAILTGASAVGTTDFSFDHVVADEAFAAVHCCRISSSGSHASEEERLLMSSASFVAVAETAHLRGEEQGKGMAGWVLKVAGTAFTLRTPKVRAKEYEQKVWLLRFDSVDRMVHWQNIFRVSALGSVRMQAKLEKLI